MPAIRTRPEDLPTGVLLAGVGGFLDAYTFVGRGGVFANAQTGNIVLLGVAAGERHWPAARFAVTGMGGMVGIVRGPVCRQSQHLRDDIQRSGAGESGYGQPERVPRLSRPVNLLPLGRMRRPLVTAYCGKVRRHTMGFRLARPSRSATKPSAA
jgi:hypothetical protein